MNEQEQNQRVEPQNCITVCGCLPYPDPYLITAQVLSVLAVSFSWIYWLTFVISLTALVLLQVIWCCRLSELWMLASAIISAMAAISSIGTGIWIRVKWCDGENCEDRISYCLPFTFETSDLDWDSWPICRPIIYSGIAFADGILWLVIFGLILFFILSRRRKKWEYKSNLARSLELATFEAVEVPIAELSNGSPFPVESLIPEQETSDKDTEQASSSAQS